MRREPPGLAMIWWTRSTFAFRHTSAGLPVPRQPDEQRLVLVGTIGRGRHQDRAPVPGPPLRLVHNRAPRTDRVLSPGRAPDRTFAAARLVPGVSYGGAFAKDVAVPHSDEPRTAAFDAKTGTLYLPTARFGPLIHCSLLGGCESHLGRGLEVQYIPISAILVNEHLRRGLATGRGDLIRPCQFANEPVLLPSAILKISNSASGQGLPSPMSAGATQAQALIARATASTISLRSPLPCRRYCPTENESVFCVGSATQAMGQSGDISDHLELP